MYQTYIASVRQTALGRLRVTSHFLPEGCENLPAYRFATDSWGLHSAAAALPLSCDFESPGAAPSIRDEGLLGRLRSHSAANPTQISLTLAWGNSAVLYSNRGRMGLAGEDGFELDDREDVLGSEVLGL